MSSTRSSRAADTARILDRTMEQQSAALRAMNDAVLAIAAEATIEPMLQRLVHAARELVDARYAAIGVPDGEGAFAQFITSGMSDELIAAMGPLPRTHGLLGAMLTSPVPYRTNDVRRDPRFKGWWPAAHPQMRSFLGVPIVAASGIVGALYLTDKVGAEEFDGSDQQLIEMLSVHAAIAIEKTQLYERSRELSIVEERNRLARELHDAVTQKLFGLTLTAEAAATVIDRDPAEAKAQLQRLQQLTREAMEELRSLIFELRPAAAESEGLATALRKHVDVLQSVHGDAVALSLEGDAEPRGSASEVMRIAQEALQNALRHADASHVDVRLWADDGRLRLAVTDDGIGFDPTAPGLRARRLGLTSMEERARALGGTLSIESRPGAGTSVVLEVPR
jgi:signal transduction histidine kinase